MISNILRDLPFSWNKRLMSADEQYTGILKNKEEKLKDILGEMKKTKNARSFI